MERLSLILFLPLFLLLSCGPHEPLPEKTKKERKIHINNGAKLHASRLVSNPRDLPIRKEIPKKPFSLLAETEEVETTFKLTLVGELDSPTLDGFKLQATDTVVDRNKLFVSYNVRGATKKGAIDLINIESPSNPTLVSQLILGKRDVNAIDHLGNSLALTGTWENEETPSYLSHVRMDDDGFTTDIEDVPLMGYVGTDVSISPTNIYVTTGDNRGLYSLDYRTLARRTYTPLYDARSVFYRKDKKELWALTGQSASIVKIKKNGSLAKKFEVGGATLPESKSTLQVGKTWLLSTIGERGFAVVCKANGNIIAEEAPPLMKPEKGMPSVTNAAVAVKSFIFSANGEEGVHIYKMSSHTRRASCNDFDLEYVGYIDFGDELSANHITAKGELLFVADGLGGLKIILLTKVIIVDDEITDFENEES